MKLGETSLYERKTNVRILFNLLVLTLTLFPVRLSPSQKRRETPSFLWEKDLLPTNEEEYSGLPVTKYSINASSSSSVCPWSPDKDIDYKAFY